MTKKSKMNATKKQKIKSRNKFKKRKKKMKYKTINNLTLNFKIKN